MMSLPRITGALRAFASVTAEEPVIGDQQQQISDKRQQKRDRQSEEGLSWEELTVVLKKYARDVNDDDIKMSLRELNHIARDLVGDEANPEYVEACGAMLFETFNNSSMVSHKETTRLRSIFGPFPASAATKACSVVNRIASWLPEDILDSLSSDKIAGKKSTPEPSFGSNIKFILPSPSSVDNYDWLESGENENVGVGVKFDMKFDSYQSSCAEVQEGATAVVEGKKKDGVWLRKEVEKQFGEQLGGMTVNDMCSSIFDMLASSKSDDALQNDLFELVGFDRFELIQNLLENRKLLISATLDTATELYLSSGKGSSGQARKQDSRPQFGCQVTIQTDEEKKIRKHQRREEKKMERKKKKVPTATLR